MISAKAQVTSGEGRSLRAQAIYHLLFLTPESYSGAECPQELINNYLEPVSIRKIPIL